MSITRKVNNADFLDNKQRRLLISKEVKNLGKSLPFSVKKSSQIRYLKAASLYIRKEKHFQTFKSYKEAKNNNEEKYLNYCKEYFSNEKIYGFVMAFSREGHLICLSETDDYLGQDQENILFLFDYIQELACNEDQYIYKHLMENHVDFFEANSFSFFTHLKIASSRKNKAYFKMFKMTGHFDVLTNMFIAKCVPILQEAIIKNNDFCVPNPMFFSTIHNVSLKICELDVNCVNILGYEKQELINKKSLYDLIDIKCLEEVKEYHKSLIGSKDKKSLTTTVQLEHKSGIYLDCIMSMNLSSCRTIICNFQLLSDIEMEYYKKYLSRINFTGLSESVFEEKLDGESDDMDEFQDEIVEENSRKRKSSVECLATKRVATESVIDDFNYPLEPFELIETVQSVQQIEVNSFLLERDIQFQEQMIDSIKEYLKLEVLNLNNKNHPNNDRAILFQGFSEIAFSPESECDSLNSNQQNLTFDEGTFFDNLNDSKKEESIQLQFFDMLSSLVN